jgi:hypothetical protein
MLPSNSAQRWADLVNAVDAQRRRLGMPPWADQWTRAAAYGQERLPPELLAPVRIRVANWTIDGLEIARACVARITAAR